MEISSSECKGWSELPSDLLYAIGGRLGPLDSTALLLLICRSWNLSMKVQIMDLQPLCMGKPWGQRFEAVTRLHAHLWRSKLHGTVTTRLPMASPMHPNEYHFEFPALLEVDLSRQDLVQSSGLMDDLARCRSLRSLRVAGCMLKLPSLIKCLSGMQHIIHIDISGASIRETFESIGQGGYFHFFVGFEGGAGTQFSLTSQFTQTRTEIRILSNFLTQNSLPICRG